MTSIAMKVYDLQWFTTFGMSYAEAAAALVDDGVDIVLTQNRIDPLPSSGVDQRVYLNAYQDRVSSYDDLAWVEALREAGLSVYQTSATFFDPAALEIFPDARPVNALGELDNGFDWYTGVCPTHDGYLAWKTARIVAAAAEYRPDGYFLQFTRYPGFWENWTADYAFSVSDRFCFCDRCRRLFADSTGFVLPNASLPVQAAAILNEAAESWYRWRAQHLAKLIKDIGDAIQINGSPSLMLNTLPFPRSDFNGSDVRRTIAAQDLLLLTGVVSRFELMTYLQILNRSVPWLIDAVGDARDLLGPDSQIVATLQVAPLYTAGVHAFRGRSQTITAAELLEAGSAALDSGVVGLAFYHWTDFLEDESAGGEKRNVLRSLAAAARSQG